MFQMHKLLVKHMTDPDKTSDCSEAISKTEKPSASEQSDTEGHQYDKNGS